MPPTALSDPLSLNDRAAALVHSMVAAAERLDIATGQGRLGNREIDCGVRVAGSVEAGRRLAEICLAGLAEVTVVPSAPGVPLPQSIRVRTDAPVLACLGSQYAGWHFSGNAEDEAFAVLGSGPARALARREEIFQELPHREVSPRAVLVLESGHPPPAAVAADAAAACSVAPDNLTILTAPTRSAAGAVQVAARAVECAVQKARLLDFPLEWIRSAEGTAPLCPPADDDHLAMGRTNDAIIYGGFVHLTVDGPAGVARRLAGNLASRHSPEWGQSFAVVFERCGGFHGIDPHFFSPAEVAVTSLASGYTFHGGGIDTALLRRFLA